MAWLRWRESAGDSQGLKTCCVCQEARGEKSWCSDCQAVELWPENLPSALLFNACETQWLRAGMDGIPTGLNYPGVQVVMAMRGDPAHLFVDVQILEREFLAISYERAKRQRQHEEPANYPSGMR